MGVVIKIVSGLRAGATVEVPEGGGVRFGRSAEADFPLPDDSFLSGVHFAIQCQEGRALVTDLGSTNGTFLNGARIRQAVLTVKDRLTAGRTTFQIKPEEKPVAAAAGAAVAVGAGVAAVGVAAAVSEPASGAGHRAPLSPLEKALVEFLGKQAEPVYAVLDAAADAFVLPLVQAFAGEYRSLYEGPSAESLADCAPYLARVAPNSRFAEELSHAWGKSWGIYLTCGQPLEDIRKHLRRFLMVKTEEGKNLFFRFYDPRVLRVFLPGCTPQEAGELLGPLRCYLVEAGEPENVLRFTLTPQGAATEVISLTVSARRDDKEAVGGRPAGGTAPA